MFASGPVRVAEVEAAGHADADEEEFTDAFGVGEHHGDPLFVGSELGGSRAVHWHSREC
ncbi:hypothetical protein [Actinoplanes teichomyceticus]|uniref:Uncharacterized protein n=1 Tax=Actinoplanes teichomyceticus TaxID=1867 RepID=A0A561VSE5_ACTTI|nr:hypothetical protein [Actinoplanes teichomyceticus]TWG14510.1 hypothetical protein FHX34_104810 [Actinoplanes teichomyceticus]GIF17251.1 hypothetical protein Ate01nite_72830 [Actinoplanes teichomyceticus]